MSERDTRDAAGGRHSESGLLRLLSFASGYRMLQDLLVRRGNFERHVREELRPFPGCAILDIGCGPGDILRFLPESVGEYVGFDMNPRYIESAQQRWGARGSFFCQRVGRASGLPSGHFDIVIATGILHHLTDAEAGELLELARTVLRPGGRLVTYDNAYIRGQHWFARLMIRMDRGKGVRTVEGYAALARPYFAAVETRVLHDTLRVPYTIVVLNCTRGPQ